MSTYVTEEEQIEQIKKWWSKHGNTISTIVLILVVCFAGYRYWQWHNQKVSIQASSLYEQMLVAYTNQDNKALVSRANKLVENHQGTVYGDAANLTLAKVATEKKSYDQAVSRLNAVIKNNKNSALTQIAKLRLARVLVAQKNYQSALNAIGTISNDSYRPLVSELRGDIYSAMGEFEKAKVAYEDALSTTRKQNVGNLFLEMKSNDVARLQLSEQASIKTV
ncbi:YfgM family protein [Legionella sp. W05-934-2]|uniref:YfgM family protein n=1 Tax=Legionella sp. W05-934-2 TaxID=1198649 RepID=UPI003462D800